MSVVPDGWEAVIGLEIHVQLNTRSKMFCRCENVLRRRAEHPHLPGLHWRTPGCCRCRTARRSRSRSRSGLALGSRIAERSLFYRKNYFYPDSPEGVPDLAVRRAPVPRRLARRARRPDGDRGRALRARAPRGGRRQDDPRGRRRGRIAGSTGSVVDFNRCGTPLLEIVTEPDLRTPEAARRFLTLLKATIQAIGVSDCDMEKGSLRCDANVSLRRPGETGLRPEGRAQEHELVPLPRARHRGRAAPPGRDLRGRRQRRAADAALRPAARRADGAALEGGGGRLPLLPRARPRADGADAELDRAAARPSCPSCRRRASRASSPSSACRSQDAEVLNQTPAMAAYFEQLAALAGDAKARGQLGHGRALGVPQRARRSSPRTRRSRPSALAQLIALVARRHARLGRRQAGVRRARRGRGRRRARSSSSAGSARSPTSRAAGRRRRGRRGEPASRPSSSARASRRCSGSSSAR